MARIFPLRMWRWFLVAAAVEVCAVMLWHVLEANTSGGTAAEVGNFTFGRGGPGGLKIGVALRDRSGGFVPVDLNTAREPILFRHPGRGYLFEIRRGRIMQHTGSIYWRFERWSVVGGSRLPEQVDYGLMLQTVLSPEEALEGEPVHAWLTPQILFDVFLLLALLSWFHDRMLRKRALS